MRFLPPLLLLAICVAAASGARVSLPYYKAGSKYQVQHARQGGSAVSADVEAESFPTTKNAISNEFVVVFSNAGGRARGKATVSTFTANATAVVVGEYKNALHGLTVRGKPALVAALIANHPDDVLSIELNVVVRKIGTQAISSSLWGLDRIDQATGRNNVYNYGSLTGAGVAIYIVDTGVFLNHAEFGGATGPSRAKWGADCTSGTCLTAFPPAEARAASGDCDGHGTHCAGTAAGSLTGVAKQATIYAVRVLDCKGSGSSATVIAGIDWVVSHSNTAKKVLSMSLGGRYSAAENTVVDNAVTAGVVVVVAAGNENTDAATTSPASAPTAITVGATDTTDTRAYFSNYGSVLDLFAPGVSIVSSVMTGGYASRSGTSMAAPFAAGAAALLREKYPSYTAAQVNAAMVAAAKSGSVINPGTGSPNLLLQIEASVCACDDSNAATLDTCTSTGACVFTPIPCSDGIGCADFVSSAGQCILCAPTPSPPPANDPFAGAIAITSGQTITGSTATATRETGEPVPGTGASASIWYRFTAPSSGASATVNLATSGFDTLLAVYTGTAVNALTLVGSNDDCATAGAAVTYSCVTFSITQGTVYSLQVDGFGGRKGSVRIAVTLQARREQ